MMTHGGLVSMSSLSLLILPQAAMAYSICVDPGHGGSAPGAVGCGLEEADVNLDTGLRLRTELQSAGFTVYMTRTTDVNVSLPARTSYANSKGVDRFVSIHSNSAENVASGIETYCYPWGSSNSFALRDLIQEEMIAAWPLPDRGGKTKDLHVLRETTMPATLTELGFINNCSVDVVYLRSGTHRQGAAVAHRRAVQRHFGITPVDTGTLRGVVYEGEVLDDRLPDATVTIVETGDSATASSGDASWSFELTPGTYTVRASLSGYTTEQRTCTVASGSTTWCSVGLTASASGVLIGVVYRAGDTSVRLSGATVTVIETGDVTTALGPSASWQFTLVPGTYTVRGSLSGYADAQRTCEVVDGEERWCSLGLPLATSAAPELVAAANSLEAEPADESDPTGSTAHGSYGCGGESVVQAGAGFGALWVLGLLASVAFRRRRVMPLFGLLALCLGAGVAHAETPMVAAAGVRFAHLQNVEVVAEGGYLAPVLAPSGAAVVFTGAKLEGLWLRSFSTGEIRLLSSAPQAGLRPVWQPGEQALALTRVGATAERAPALVIDLRARVSTASAATPTVTVTQTDDDVIVLVEDGEPRVISGGREPFFAPVLSPDGEFVAYNGLYSGVYVYRVADGVTVSLGAGNSPSFSPKCDHLVFDRTSDDGERVTAGDIYITDLKHPLFATAPLTETADRIERHPSLAHAGLLAFSAGGRIYTATVVIDR